MTNWLICTVWPHVHRNPLIKCFVCVSIWISKRSSTIQRHLTVIDLLRAQTERWTVNGEHWILTLALTLFHYQSHWKWSVDKLSIVWLFCLFNSLIVPCVIRRQAFLKWLKRRVHRLQLAHAQWLNLFDANCPISFIDWKWRTLNAGRIYSLEISKIIPIYRVCVCIDSEKFIIILHTLSEFV